jgi:hypothetical protein
MRSLYLQIIVGQVLVNATVHNVKNDGVEKRDLGRLIRGVVWAGNKSGHISFLPQKNISRQIVGTKLSLHNSTGSIQQEC